MDSDLLSSFLTGVLTFLRSEAAAEELDLLVCLLRSEYFPPELSPERIGRMFNAYVAWNNAVENVSNRA